MEEDPTNKKLQQEERIIPVLRRKATNEDQASANKKALTIILKHSERKLNVIGTVKVHNYHQDSPCRPLVKEMLSFIFFYDYKRDFTVPHTTPSSKLLSLRLGRLSLSLHSLLLSDFFVYTSATDFIMLFSRPRRRHIDRAHL